MSDNDLIRRGDALAEIELYIGEWSCSRDAIAYMPAAPAQPAAVKVKPLVWEAGERDQRRAYSVVGEFCVTLFGGRWIYKGEPRNGILDAQAAAQADYDARIMAALDVQPLTVQDAARVLLISSDRGVCVGGRWDGWLMIRHPDGHWVSHHKLDAVDPRTEMTDALRAIAEGK